ncbi:alkyl hydroperoxide reductase subunit F [Moraxella macacae 0408225]|uniref:Alkyl hydroperoxide reductase subunit F n=1 Tax=Moraxella macacae 0408225 TaxID=1230338 RepID=L2F6D9_9GAMM|nr:alkyl hydroperoxide reductase subunit F [Moraxella macacae]ELA08013.1 alkyl hydroperoxide reductase subunit F [Moraxella macacae 0408225]
MIDKNLLDAIATYSERMNRAITFVMGSGDHEKRTELVKFLTQVASATDKIVLAENTDDTLSPMSFKIQTQGADTGIVFSGIPSGHEFTSLILAVLQSGGSELKLDESIQTIIKNIKQPLKFQTFVSLSCHNCPDVVQSLNQFALLNDGISNEMIDGGVFPDLVNEKNIQGVPAVFLNGKPFANGKIDTAKLIEKLQENFPDLMSGIAPSQSLPLQDVTVLGGGPAGVAASIYTARKGLKVTLVTDRMGGQVKDTQDIENLISVPLTNGNELSNNCAKHVKEYPITIKEMVSVKQVTENDDLTYKITLNTGETFATRTVIVATGAKWRKLSVKGEDENIGNGVAFCPHCDGPFFKGKNVAVIGGGNSGVEAALDLAGIVNHVTLIEYGDKLRADQVLVNKAKQRDNIEIMTGIATQEITANNGKVNAIVYQDRSTGENKTLELSAVFVQIGLVPNSEVVKHLVETTNAGEIQIDVRCATSRRGIFACGDVTTVPFKQINIAMGEGAKAGLSAFEYLVMQ